MLTFHSESPPVFVDIERYFCFILNKFLSLQKISSRKASMIPGDGVVGEGDAYISEIQMQARPDPKGASVPHADHGGV